METDPEKPPSLENYPWLVYLHGDDFADKRLFSFSDPVRSRALHLPELKSKYFWASSSCSRWCLFSDESNGGDFCLWNSSTLDTISLPFLEIEDEGPEGVLFGSPEDSDFQVSLFSKLSPLIKICQVGAYEWSEINYNSELVRCLGDEAPDVGFFYRTGNPIWYKGKLYLLSALERRTCFVIEEFHRDHVFIETMDIKFPVMPPYATTHFKEQVVEFDGEVYSVFVHCGLDDDQVIAADVYRFDFVDMAWVEVENVPHLVFFLGDGCSFCCQASLHGIKGNRIYFFLNDDLRILMYDIGDGTLSAHQLVMDEETPYLSPFWLMLDQRLSSLSEEVENDHIVLEERLVDVRTKGKESRWNMLLERADAEKMICCDLRADVAESIGQYLSPIENLQFRATCKTCRSVSPLGQFKESLPSTLKNDSSVSPLLMFLEKGNMGAFIDPVRSDKYPITLAPQLLGCVICYSKDGYLVMAGECFRSPFLLNPFTRKLLPFPHTQVREFETYCVGFSSNQSSDYLVVTASKFIDDVYVTLAHSGMENCYENVFPDPSGFSFCDNNPVIYKGAIYFLGEDGNLGFLKPVGNGFTWEVHRPTELVSSYKQKFLLECQGKLLSVFVSYFEKQVRVFAWNSSSMKWIDVHGLGKYMIFVSNSSSFSMIARIPVMENKIYFPRLFGQSIVFYSIETKMFRTFETKGLEVDVYNTREQLRSCWIDPVWH